MVVMVIILMMVRMRRSDEVPCLEQETMRLGWLGEGARNKKVKQLTSVRFMYVCVTENAELLVFFYFFLHLPNRQFSFRREVLNHHTPPPIPKLSSITKTRILFVFLPKKVPVFCLYFYKNEPV